MEVYEMTAYGAAIFTLIIQLYKLWIVSRRGQPLVLGELILFMYNHSEEGTKKILKPIIEELRKSENKNFEYTLRLEDKIKKLIKKFIEDEKNNK